MTLRDDVRHTTTFATLMLSTTARLNRQVTMEWLSVFAMNRGNLP
jgi:hypothetical protein